MTVIVDATRHPAVLARGLLGVTALGTVEIGETAMAVACEMVDGTVTTAEIAIHTAAVRAHAHLEDIAIAQEIAMTATDVMKTVTDVLARVPLPHLPQIPGVTG